MADLTHNALWSDIYLLKLALLAFQGAGIPAPFIISPFAVSFLLPSCHDAFVRPVL